MDITTYNRYIILTVIAGNLLRINLPRAGVFDSTNIILPLIICTISGEFGSYGNGTFIKTIKTGYPFHNITYNSGNLCPRNY